MVFGGRSSEHSISCISAGSVIAALDPEKYDVVPVGIATDGRWVLESAEPGHLALGPSGELPSVTGKREVALTPGQGLVVTEPGDVPDVLGDVDVVFPVMHGPWGQDGTLQGLLEMADVRYVGAGVLSSAVGTDKHFMKQLFMAAGLPVLPYVLVRPRQWERDPAAVREAVEALDYPVFVKPARAGSSFGISRVDDASGLDEAIEEARRFDPKVLVEAAAGNAREVEIGVLQGLDGGDPETSAIAEITVAPEHTFYDFEAKYLEQSYRIPASLNEDVTEQVRDARRTRVRGTRRRGPRPGRLLRAPDNRVLVNEVETMPGVHRHLDVPAAVAGVGPDLPRARRAARPAGAGPGDRAALTHAQGETTSVCCLMASATSTMVASGGRYSAGTTTSTAGSRPIVVSTTSSPWSVSASSGANQSTPLTRLARRRRLVALGGADAAAQHDGGVAPRGAQGAAVGLAAGPLGDAVGQVVDEREAGRVARPRRPRCRGHVDGAAGGQGERARPARRRPPPRGVTGAEKCRAIRCGRRGMSACA